MKNITILFLILLSLSSCSVVNKVFHKNKSRIDSTSVTHETKDSTATEDQISLHKDSSQTSDEIVIEFAENDTTIRKYSVEADDYFTITREGISTNKPIKTVRIKTSQSVFNYDSLVNHSRIEVSEVKDNTTHLEKKEKEVLKQVRKTKLWWWLLLLIPAYLIYRNWPKIKAIVIHLFTGLCLLIFFNACNKKTVPTYNPLYPIGRYTIPVPSDDLLPLKRDTIKLEETGRLRFMPTDTSIYIYDGQKWVKTQSKSNQ